MRSNNRLIAEEVKSCFIFKNTSGKFPETRITHLTSLR